jgi:TetR/AcrR family transcriptional repressor of nem operon
VKASQRRAAILACAAPIFNQRGFAGTSISEILAAASLEKGGLYNHFASKEELAIAAFEYAWNEVEQHFARALRGCEPGAASLHAYVRAFERYAERPVVKGGCPLANAALDADDALPFLRERDAGAFGKLQSFLRRHAVLAVSRGEFAAGTDADAVADFVVASLEGALLLTRGLRSRASSRRVTATLQTWLHSLERNVS